MGVGLGLGLVRLDVGVLVPVLVQFLSCVDNDVLVAEEVGLVEFVVLVPIERRFM